MGARSPGPSEGIPGATGGGRLCPPRMRQRGYRETSRPSHPDGLAAGARPAGGGERPDLRRRPSTSSSPTATRPTSKTPSPTSGPTRCWASASPARGPSTMPRTSSATSSRPWASPTCASRPCPSTPGTSRARRSRSATRPHRLVVRRACPAPTARSRPSSSTSGTGTAAEFDAAGDVTGKLVLVDGEFDDWWLNFVGAEATHRGAAGVVMTYGENTYPWYSYPEALGSNDGEYDDDWVPMVYVAWQDGDWIKEQLAAAGRVTDGHDDERRRRSPWPRTAASATTWSACSRAAIPTSRRCSSRPHLDAHFRAGLDDTGAVGQRAAHRQGDDRRAASSRGAPSSSSSPAPRSTATPTAGTTGRSAPGTRSRRSIPTGPASSR